MNCKAFDVLQIILTIGILAPLYCNTAEARDSSLRNTTGESTLPLFLAKIEDLRSEFKANGIVTFSSLRWVVNGQNAEKRVKSVMDLSKVHAAEVSFANPKEADEAAAGYLNKVQSILGQSTHSTWRIHFFNEAMKFEELLHLSDEQQQKLETQAKESGATLKFDRNTQWLFTDTTSYRYGDGSAVLQARPLDPFSHSYPVRLDEALQFFAFKEDSIELLDAGSITVNEGEIELSISDKGTTSTQTLVFRMDEVIPRLTSVRVTIAGRGVLSRFYLFSAKDLLGGLSLPTIITNISCAPDETCVVDIYSIESIDSGSVKVDDIALRVPKGTAVADEMTAAPVLIK